ncbi:Phage XkdN-like protein [compost metagenome]
MDEEQFGALVIQKACLIPDWSARELVDKYGSPTDAILGLLLAGEVAKLSTEILEISGFDSDEDEIKN